MAEKEIENSKTVNDNTQPGENIRAVFNFIKENYKPADDFETCELKLSTKDIYHNLQEFCPGDDYCIQDVFDFLLKAGYKYSTPYGDLEFVWMLIYNK